MFTVSKQAIKVKNTEQERSDINFKILFKKQRKQLVYLYISKIRTRIFLPSTDQKTQKTALKSQIMPKKHILFQNAAKIKIFQPKIPL